MPDAPTNLMAESIGEARIRLTWTPPSSVSEQRVYYDTTTALPPAYDGSGAAEGDSFISTGWATVTFDINDLYPDRYAAAITGVSAGIESPYSNLAQAASRWCQWYDSMQRDWWRILVSCQPGLFWPFLRRVGY